MAQLQKTNTEREAKNLAPFEWCGEAYRFDKGWAVSDPSCAKRVKAYEAGDSSALQPDNVPSTTPLSP